MRIRAQAKPTSVKLQHAGPLVLKPTVLTQAVRTALPILLGGALMFSALAPADAVSPTEAGAVNATIDIVRQFSQRVSLAQSAGYLDEQVSEVDGFPRAARMSPLLLNFAPADVRPVPVITGLPRRDGAGRPLGYCAWDNTSSTNVSIGGTLAYLAGNIPGNTDKLLYAVISPGRDGRIETSCADVLLLQQTIQSERGGGLGDDLVYARRPLQQSSRTFRASVGTAGNLPTLQNTEGDVRLVMDSNTLYAYNGGAWKPIGGSPDEKFVGDGAGNLSYTGGKVTVAEFEATAATFSNSITVNGTATVNGNATINGTLSATNLTGNAAGLTDLNASNISTGTLAVARGGTGLSAAPGVNQILIGNGTGYDLSTVTAGTGIGVVNAGGLLTISNTGLLSIASPMGTVNLTTTNGAVEIDLPQSIAMTATPTFGGMMLNGGLMGTTATFSGTVNANQVFANGQELKPITKPNIDAALTFPNQSTYINQPNLALGTNALSSTFKSGGNVAIGDGVLSQLNGADTSLGEANTGVGYRALYANLNGYSNTAIGNLALTSNLTGIYNTSVGASALLNNTTGSFNTATGNYALKANTTGVYNTATGYSALINNTTGSYNTAVGTSALLANTTGLYNTAVGSSALKDNTVGESNSAFGYIALWNNTSGSENTAMGRLAMRDNTTGSENTGLGALALYSNTTANFNTAIGSRALYRTNTGNSNVAVGQDAAYSGTTASNNVAIGRAVMRSLTTGSNNVALGSFTLNGITTGSANVALGRTAGHANGGYGGAITATTVGNRNTFLGTFSGAEGGSQTDYATALGADSRVATSDTLVLGALAANKTGSVNDDQVVIGATSRNNTFANTKLYVNGVTNLNGDLRATTATFTGAVNALSFTGNGSALTNLNAANITTGVLGVANGGTGISTAPTSGQLLIGNGTGYTLGTIAGTVNQINVTNGAGTITLSLPQNIATTSTPTFGGMTLNGGLTGTNATFTGQLNATQVFANGQELKPITKANIDAALTFPNQSTFVNQPNLALGNNALGGAFKSGGNVAIGDGVLSQLDGSDTSSGEANTGVGYRALYANSTGYQNTAIGNMALTSNENGTANNAFGAGALLGNISGSHNNAFGTQALASNTEGIDNTAIGHAALYSNSTGVSNIAIGGYSMVSNTSGENNVAVGSAALYSNTTGSSNTATGYFSMFENTTGYENTASGFGALGSNTTGFRNVAVGYLGLSSNTSGFYNTAVGGAALKNNSTGSYNTGVGLNALGLNSTGERNTAMGLSAMYNNTVGTTNTAIGFEALVSNTNGSGNTAIGNEAMHKNMSGIQSVAVGSGALYAGVAAHYSTAVGFDALRNSQAIDNSAFGFAALRANTSGTDNTAVGKNTLIVNTTGNENVAVGAASLYNATTASFNTAIGSRALYRATTGGSNVAIGQDAAYNGTTANTNVSVGRSSMRAVTTGSGNVAVGGTSLNSITTGNNNVAVGRQAGQGEGGAATATTTGTRNTFVGAYASATGGAQNNYSTAIGANSLVATADTVVLGALGINKASTVVDDQVVIGTTSRNDTYANTKLYVNGVTNLNGDLRGTTATFTGAVNALSFTGNGSGLTNLNAGNITTGVLSVTNGGTGLSTAPTNGQLLIGNGTGYSLGTLTGTADQINVTNGAGTITLSLPQSIATTSIPTFGGMNLNGSLNGTAATFSGAITASSVTASRLDIFTSAGVTNPNMIVGTGAMVGAQTSFGSNAAVGLDAMAANTSGFYNTAVGNYALTSNTSGYGNVASGRNALFSNTTGNTNSATGSNALYSNTSGLSNTANGGNTLYSNNSGSFNAATGVAAMYSNTTGYENTGTGVSALFYNTTGYRNAADGSKSLYSNTTGFNNAALGYESGKSNTTGSNNTFLGALANAGSGNLTYATAIGAGSIVNSNNTIALGRNSNVDQVVIGTNSRSNAFANTKLYVNGVTNLNGDLRGTTATFTGAVNALSFTGNGSDLTNLNAGNITTGVLSVTNGGTGLSTAPTIGQLLIGNGTGYSLGTLTGTADQINVTNGAGTITLSLPQSIATTSAPTFGGMALNGALTGTAATFSGAVTASSVTTSRLDISTSAGVSNPNMIVGTGAMASTQSGTGSNTALGVNALAANTAGYYNVATGSHALYSNTTGYQNTALGDGAMYFNTTGSENTALGNSALQLNASGSNNTAVGNFALFSNTTGERNSVLGSFALLHNTFGERNVAVGSSSLYYNTDGYSNVAIGNEAMYNNIDGARNVAIGERALYSNYDGYFNVAVGEDALYGNTYGYFNVAMGNRAIESNTSGSANVAIGMEIMRSNTTGNENIAIGYHAFDNNTTGNNNVAIGQDALSANTTGSFNTALGYNSNTGSGNLSYATAIGAGSRVNSNNMIALGRNSNLDQVVIGSNARNNTYANTKLYVNGISNFNGALYGTTATFSGAVTVGSLTAPRLNVSTSAGVSSPNLIIGTGAIAGAQSGSGDNTAVGISALSANTSGDANVALGSYSLGANSTGYVNVALGLLALGSNSSGFANSATGFSALGGNTTGSENTASGVGALNFNSTGSYNVALGTSAGFKTLGGVETYANTTGSYNLFLGAYAAPGTSTQLSYAAAIGAASSVSTSDTLALGRNSAADQVVIGTDTRNGAHKLYVNGTALGTAWNTTSDRRLKTEIVSLDSDVLLEKLGMFNAHRYRYIANPEAGYRIGVIAQDLQNLFPEVAGYNGGAFLSVDYNALGAMAAAGVGRLNTKFNTFEKFTKEKFDSVDKEITFLKTETAKIKGLEDWRDSANTRMDTMQVSIDKNLAKITENTLAIENNTAQIKRLDEVLVTLDGTVKGQGEAIEKINTRWGKNFAASEDGSLLTVTAAELKVNNFTAQQMRANAVYTQRLEAEIAAIRDLEVDNLKANSAVANTVQAKQVNTGAVQVYAGVGAPAFLFAAPGDGHYTINTSAMDGSYATATVIVNAGQAKVVTIASEGIELLATGNTIKALAAGKSIKASWIKTG